LKTIPHLRTLNSSAGGIQNIVKDTGDSLKKRFHARFKREIEGLANFIPWDIERNTLAIRVDISDISLDTVWVT
jgi:hypothetical protein